MCFSVKEKKGERIGEKGRMLLKKKREKQFFQKTKRKKGKRGGEGLGGGKRCVLASLLQ